MLITSLVVQSSFTSLFPIVKFIREGRKGVNMGKIVIKYGRKNSFAHTWLGRSAFKSKAYSRIYGWWVIKKWGDLSVSSSWMLPYK